MQIHSTSPLGLAPVKESKGKHFQELAPVVQKMTQGDVVDLGNAPDSIMTYKPMNAVQKAASLLFDQITANFGQEVGKNQALQKLDLDMDGEIGPSDYEAAVSIARWGDSLPDFDAISAGFGLAAGDKGFDSRLDLDMDGEIGPGDFETAVRLADLRSPDVTRTEISDRFGSVAGDKGYDSRFDLDGDGEIGPGDFEKVADLESAGSESTQKTLSELLGQLLRNPAIAQGLDLNGDGLTTKSDIAGTISALS